MEARPEPSTVLPAEEETAFECLVFYALPGHPKVAAGQEHLKLFDDGHFVSCDPSKELDKAWFAKFFERHLTLQSRGS